MVLINTSNISQSLDSFFRNVNINIINDVNSNIIISQKPYLPDLN